MKPKVTNHYQFPETPTEMPFGPASRAGVLIDINSGWRTFYPVIDKDTCIKCQMCWLICPDGVITRDPDGYTVDYDYCKGCGLCAYECPRHAIKMVKEGE